MAKVRGWHIAIPLLALLACGEPRRHAQLEEEVLRLTRESHALRGAVAEANAGNFIHADDVIVGVHEDVVADLLKATLPVEVAIPGVIAAESVTARVDHATVVFNGGFGTVTVDGRAWFTRFPSVAADVHLSGGVSEVIIDPATHALTATIGLDTLEAKPLPGGLGSFVFRGRLLHLLNARARDSIAGALPPLVVPLKVDENVHLAGVDSGPLRVAGGELELSAGLRHVFASDGRLWVALTPKLGAFRKNAVTP